MKNMLKQNHTFSCWIEMWPMFIGVLTCGAIFMLWIILWFYNPYQTQEPSEIITTPGIFMALLCIAGSVAALRLR